MLADCNRFLDGRREVLQGYYSRTGADVITGAEAAAGKLTALREKDFGHAANDYQRRRLGGILDARLAASKDGIARHVAVQQEVHVRSVASDSIATARAGDRRPTMLDNALFRAESAARTLHTGQPPAAAEAGVRIGRRRRDRRPSQAQRSAGRGALRQYADRLDPSTRRTLSTAAGTLSNTFDAAAWLRDRTATLRAPEPTGDAALDTVNAAGASMAVTLNGRNVGIDASTQSPTSTLTVMTDEFGNLVAIFPGRMP